MEHCSSWYYMNTHESDSAYSAFSRLFSVFMNEMTAFAVSKLPQLETRESGYMFS